MFEHLTLTDDEIDRAVAAYNHAFNLEIPLHFASSGVVRRHIAREAAREAFREALRSNAFAANPTPEATPE